MHTRVYRARFHQPPGHTYPSHKPPKTKQPEPDRVPTNTIGSTLKFALALKRGRITGLRQGERVGIAPLKQKNTHRIKADVMSQGPRTPASHNAPLVLRDVHGVLACVCLIFRRSLTLPDWESGITQGYASLVGRARPYKGDLTTQKCPV